MINIFSIRLSEMSAREKILMTLTAISLLTYITYIFAFQSLLDDIGLAQKKLAEFNKTRQKIEIVRDTIPKLGKELLRLRSDLSKKQKREKTLNGILMAGGRTGSVLRSLEEGARNMNLQLLDLTAATIPMKKSQRALRQKKQGVFKTANAEFTKNRIRLKYRSGYPAAVNYLSKMMKLPYAISLVSVKMSPSEIAAGSRMLVTTTVELEIFSR